MKIKKSLRDFLIPFLIGYLLKEIVVFVNEKGFEPDHQLARCLFFIILCFAGLLWLWANDEIENVKTNLEEITKKLPPAKEPLPSNRLLSPPRIISYKLNNNIDK